ncbi:TetR/AcrR family transcriptional regulator [Rhodococcoides yunnanense]|uniref:TetR/AcrR family transcriptional regulator n=1 Tax=Rhodococcoides yunnanense TaxID=278209 RepID=UPI0011147FF8|nr:TetR/AcrR family transcriptional regulator [Rhodococcus yunnanensis]
MSMPTTDHATAPPRATGSARAQEILAIGARLFEQNGFAATTVQDIGDAAGVLPGSLYHHFESKDAIAVALIAEFDADVTAVARASLGTDTSGFGAAQARAHLLALCRDLTTVIRRHAAAVRLRAYQAPLVAGPALQAAVRAESPILTRSWTDALAAVLRQPGISHERPGLLRFAFHRSTLAAATAYPRHLSSDAIADQLCDILLDGILSDSPSAVELNTSTAARRAERFIAGWRRNDAKDLDPKARLLLAAKGEFARHGYEASTIRGIADAAGITMGTLYRRAESKEAILREILERYSGDLDSAVRGVLSDVTSVAESLDALARLYVHASRRFAAEASIVKLGSDADQRSDSPFSDYLAQTEDRLVLLENVFAMGLREGSIRPISTASIVALHFRQVIWLPYQEHGRTGERRAHSFIREDVLGGAQPSSPVAFTTQQHVP